MRLLALLICMVMILPSTQALGIAVIESVKDGFDLDTGDEVDITFYIRGDEKANDITFFIRQESSQTRALEFDGEDEYSEEFIISPFENEEVKIEMRAERSGVHEVYYGYRIEATDGLEIDSVVQDRFRVVVDGEDKGSGQDDHDIDILVPASGSSTFSTGGSGGGGGGGGGGALVNPEIGIEGQDSLTDENVEANLQDISTQGSALSQAVVEQNSDPSVANQLTNTNAVSSDGKKFLMYILLGGAVALLVNMLALGYVAREQK